MALIVFLLVFYIHNEHLEVCPGTGNKRRGLQDWEKWQTREKFWKRMSKKFEEREIEEMKKGKKEEKAQKRTGCEAETQGKVADHQEVETAGEPTEDATVTLVHGDGKGGVPRDPPEPDPYCR